MSGPAVHHIIATEFLKNELKLKYTDTQNMSFWNTLDSDKQGKYAPYYHFGAVGPDFLFFNLSDWPVGVKTIAQIYLEITDFLENLRKSLIELIPQELIDAIDSLNRAVDIVTDRSVILSEIKSLLEDVRKNIEVIKGQIKEKIKEWITDSFDIFNLLSHPIQDGMNFTDWWWFDTLHYRRTGKFLKELMKNSAPHSAERAYALGYLTHYATDTVGHPFVNAISGGPFRTHAQRHKTAENYQDVWAYTHYESEEFAKSKLAEKYIIDGNSTKLPSNLSSFITNCIHNVYYQNGSPLYGKDIKADDLDISYAAWSRWFKNSTDDDLPKPVPYSITKEIAEAWEKFETNVGGVFNYIGTPSLDNGGILNLFEWLASLILGSLLLAISVIDFLIGTITTLAVAPLRFFLSFTYELLYDAYMNFRQGLAMNGFAFPYSSQLDHRFTKNLVNSRQFDHFNRNASSLYQNNLYPTKDFIAKGIEAESHLVYPFPYQENLEKDSTTACPSRYISSTPSYYMTSPSVNFNKNLYEFYKNFKGFDTDFEELKQMGTEGGLGNAVTFSGVLFDDFINLGGESVDYADFNLDADRGYAFKCWRKVQDKSLIDDPINDYKKTNALVDNGNNNEVLNTQMDIIDPDGSIL